MSIQATSGSNFGGICDLYIAKQKDKSTIVGEVIDCEATLNLTNTELVDQERGTYVENGPVDGNGISFNTSINFSLYKHRKEVKQFFKKYYNARLLVIIRNNNNDWLVFENLYLSKAVNSGQRHPDPNIQNFNLTGSNTSEAIFGNVSFSTSSLSVDEDDIGDISLDATGSQFNGMTTGGTQGTHKWQFQLNNPAQTTVEIEGAYNAAITAPHITILESVGLFSTTGTYADLQTIEKNPLLTDALNYTVDIKHFYDGNNSGNYSLESEYTLLEWGIFKFNTDFDYLVHGSFDPAITYPLGTQVKWVFANSTSQSGTSINLSGASAQAAGLTGVNQTVRLGCSRELDKITSIDMDDDRLTGSVDFTEFINCLTYNFQLNQITEVIPVNEFTQIAVITVYRFNGCNITGDLKTPKFFTGNFEFQSNPNLTGFIFNADGNPTSNFFLADNCNLTGSVNIPVELGGVLGLSNNPNLTSVTFKPSDNTFSTCVMHSCNLTGTLNLPFSKLGGNCQFQGNANLTKINFTESSEVFSLLRASNCNLTGVQDVPFSNLGGTVEFQNNPNLTNINFTQSSQAISSFFADDCSRS